SSAAEHFDRTRQGKPGLVSSRGSGSCCPCMPNREDITMKPASSTPPAGSQGEQAPGSSTPPISPGHAAPAGTPGTGENICPRCSGSGRVDGQPCPDCDGTGTVVTGVGGA